MPMVFRGPTASAGHDNQALKPGKYSGLKAVVPSTVYDAKGLLKSSNSRDTIRLFSWKVSKCMAIK
jgi:pyruvate/2-oxoglutarate/acetoin dehydrogenase E1 component